MVFESIRVGIVFNAVVSAILAAISLAFAVFLFRRRNHLDVVMRSYAWFWISTLIVWGAISARYLLIGFGYADPYGSSLVYYSDVVLQSAIFFTGPPLLYYLGMRVFHKLFLARAVALISVAIACYAVFILISPGGITPPSITYFSADAAISHKVFMIFAEEIAVVFLLLLFDVTREFEEWHQKKNIDSFYYMFYSLAILIYVVLGSIDQSKIIIDWPLIVFRLLYSGAFLMAYLTMVDYEAAHEQYLIEEPNQ